jgi:hypothetical protein
MSGMYAGEERKGPSPGCENLGRRSSSFLCHGVWPEPNSSASVTRRGQCFLKSPCEASALSRPRPRTVLNAGFIHSIVYVVILTNLNWEGFGGVRLFQNDCGPILIISIAVGWILPWVVIKPENPCYIRLANTWIILNSGGGPTPDKPEVVLETPSDLNRVNSFLNLRVADIWACYKQWGDKGARFYRTTRQSRLGTALLHA